MNRARGLFWALMLVVAALQGCATTDRKADILYQPAANVKGGAGDLYLVQDVRQPGNQAAGVQWILGSVTKNNGKQLSRIVTEMAPGSLVMDALNQELRWAGYNVIVTDKMPDQAKKAVTLKEAIIRIDDKHSAFKDEANCSVNMSVQPWKNGAATGTVGYEAEYTETAVSGREQLPSTVLQKALQSLMTRAVPGIVKTLEQK